MKNLILTIILILTTLPSFSQNIEGQWNGILNIKGTQVRLIFNITQTNNGFTATLDSPDQGAKDIEVNKTSFENQKLTLEITNFLIKYEGILKNNIITGTFNQGGQSFPLNLSKEIQKKAELKRPQEPTRPPTYIVDNVKFKNTTDNITLAGTLTLPKKEGIFTTVVLISGSGAQNRNEELLGHKPFLVLADYLTNKGIAVLRFDDRGTAESEGDFNAANTKDLANDVNAAINYLKTRKEVDKKHIGLIGHSEGGIIAPMIAANSKDIDFIVLMAGTGIPGNELLLLQQSLIAKASGDNEEDIEIMKNINKNAFDIIISADNQEQAQKKLTEYLTMAITQLPKNQMPKGIKEDDFIKLQVNELTSPWMQYFLKYNPADALEQVNCAVLAINGSKDLQVPATVNLEAIKKALEKGGNKNVTIKEFQNLNHLFQECKVGLPSEYEVIEQTISPMVLDEISNWIHNTK